MASPRLRLLPLEARKPAFRSPDARATVAEDLAATIGDAIDDLEAEPDARRAVIAAYARMESGARPQRLSARAERDADRVPSAHPARRSPHAATRSSRLTTLFQQAKFSKHEIDAAMKQDAIGALREIRDDLRERRA